MRFAAFAIFTFVFVGSTFGQCPQWDSLGLGVSHSDNISLLKLVCPDVFSYDGDLLLRSYDNQRTINLQLTDDSKFVSGFVIKDVNGKVLEKFNLDKLISVDLTEEFGINILSAQCNSRFSFFRFVIKISDVPYIFNLSTSDKELSVFKATENSYGSYMYVYDVPANRLDYLELLKHVKIKSTVKVVGGDTIPLVELTAVSIHNDTMSLIEPTSVKFRKIIPVNISLFYLQAPDALWLCEIGEGSINILNKIIQDETVDDLKPSPDRTRGVRYVLDSFSNVIGFLHVVEGSINFYILDELITKISNPPAFMGFIEYSYYINDVLYFYTNGPSESPLYNGSQRVFGRVTSHKFDLSQNSGVIEQIEFKELEQNGIDGRWHIGDVSSQTFFNPYQSGKKLFRLWINK